MLRGTLLAALFVLGALGGLAPPAGALTFVVAEAEARTRDAGACAGDGESMFPFTLGEDAGTLVLFYPNDGCWAEWDLDLPADATLAARWYGPGGSGECGVVKVAVDGAPKGSSSQVCGLDVLATFALPGTVPQGRHTLRLTFQVTSGPGWINLYMDRVELSLGVPQGCPTNGAPSPPGALKADGLGNGGFGWVGFSYTFTSAAAVDPEGDPVAYTWAWGDGAREQGGLSAAHAWSGTGLRFVVLSATDDPSARDVQGCPALSPRTTPSPTLRFTPIPDFATQLTRPTATQSCVADFTFRSPTGQNVLAGPCRVRAAVSTDYPALVKDVAFRVDATAFAADASAPYEATYDSLSVFPGDHVLDACAAAVNDKYARALCSGGYAYINVGLGL